MSTDNLAILIDADNASADIVEGLFREAAKYGNVITKRIYGNWTDTKQSKWKQCLLDYAIIPVQQFSYTPGKNATDMAMVIDAMDLLYGGKVDGFCIVSSDSDFTPLASRIRDEGLTVYGFGECKTPSAFRKACDKFILTDNFTNKDTLIDIEEKNRKFAEEFRQKQIENTDKHLQNKIKNDTKLMNTIRDAIDTYSDDTGWASLGPVGSYISRVLSDFDVKTHGFSKLSDFIKSIDLFETKQVDSHLKVRRKK